MLGHCWLLGSIGSAAGSLPGSGRQSREAPSAHHAACMGSTGGLSCSLTLIVRSAVPALPYLPLLRRGGGAQRHSVCAGGGPWRSCPQRAGWQAAGRALRLLQVPWALRCGCRCCVSPGRSTLGSPRLALAPNEGLIKLATKREEGRLVVVVCLPRAVVLECSHALAPKRVFLEDAPGKRQ